MSIENQLVGIKVVLLGDAAAGKSSLLLRYTTGQFNSQIDSTIGAAFKSKVITKGEKQFRLDIWDTAGQERYRSILPMYYRNAAAAVLVIDVTEKRSLEVAARWILDIHQKTDKADCYIILAVNKVDLSDKALTVAEIQQFCEENGIDSIETSAKSGYNVTELFEQVCDKCMNVGKEVASSEVISCSQPPPAANTGCCKCHIC